MRKTVLIYNPTAGALRHDLQQIEKLTAALNQRGIQIVPMPTRYAGHATELAAQATTDKAPTVIVCGGDGTINEVAQALVGTETTLAVWPCGTANVLAEELRLPRDFDGLAKLIAENSVRTISVGKAVKRQTGWQRYFLLMAGIGLDATIVQNVRPELKKSFGKGAYFASGMEFLARLPLTPFSIKFNDQSHESTFTVISNAAHYASLFTLAPGAAIDDDKLNVCVFNSRSRLAYLGYAALSLIGGHTVSPGVVYQETGNAHANSNDHALVQIDGDVMGTLPMDFEIVPEALRIFAPTVSGFREGEKR
ncbi:MAG: diacylglycerol kinase family lipid kinase [Acidobacteriota bacterium]|nr:diacylglycerol kinase family lipid kinase [Acidobacteriota bacterium]